ncbi:SLIT and NTRK-like protein 6 isoform X1 [Epinephelus fuscoguttatus]|uniref:SLIT and NTRK-like protein 6 isoform X1 n=1 Tax=Epinephelus fuscoguttatus TaxID=293821 RepID=UPI0020D02FEF|nr:SLIT and NTRK-like protein 6 isoform X1 [Epinephelus fuscoguttatus]
MQLFLILLSLLSSHITKVTGWAGCTRDRDRDYRTRENCTALGFSDVPAGFDPTTKVMLFTNNLFSSLSWSSFQIFTAIYEIDLSGNKIPQVTSSVTPILPTLSVLRLGSNRLTSLSDGSFTACPALTELYLDNNVLDSLSDHTFSGLSKLEILDLSSNRIKVLPELMLHPLPAIETLYLESNKIMVMPDDWFSKKEAVPYLFLSANPWACSCSLGYLRRYLDNYEFNVYTREGPIIQSDAESVVCHSPQCLKNKPVMTLEESDLCPPAPEPNPAGDSDKQTVHTDTVAPPHPTVRPSTEMTICAIRCGGVFCFWLCAGCLLLCVASVTFILVILVWLVGWCKRDYNLPNEAVARRGGGGEVVMLSTYSRREEKEGHEEE